MTTIPTNEEVKPAIFSFDGSKAPGPDGFPLFFFQWLWEIVEEDVVNAIKGFFGSRSLLKELNASFLVLIPKKPGANNFEAFRPISLCNSLYKIISKVLTSRF